MRGFGRSLGVPLLEPDVNLRTEKPFWSRNASERGKNSKNSGHTESLSLSLSLYKEKLDSQTNVKVSLTQRL